MYSFSYLEPVCCSMSSSNCCSLTCIQISQEAGQVVWYSHLFQNFPQVIVIIFRVHHAKLDEDWMKHRLKSRLLGEISPQICRRYHPMAESGEELKSLLMRVKEKSEKAGLNVNTQKTKIRASGLITSWQTEGVKVEAVTDFLFLGSQITVTVTSAMKLKDTCSLKGKL